MIVVTGATGKLGLHVMKGLAEKVPAAKIVAAVRNPEKAADLAALGIQVRQADYSKPETLRSGIRRGGKGAAHLWTRTRPASTSAHSRHRRGKEGGSEAAGLYQHAACGLLYSGARGGA